MNYSVTITVPGIPVSQPRQRHRVVTAGGRTFAQNYVPKRDPVNAFKALIALAAGEKHPGAPLEGPVCLHLELYFPRPKRLVWKTKPMPRLPHDTKPDVDNLLKAVADALTGVLFRDDSQIWDCRVTKTYCAGGEQPKTRVTIFPDGGPV